MVKADYIIKGLAFYGITATADLISIAKDIARLWPADKAIAFTARIAGAAVGEIGPGWKKPKKFPL